MDDDVYGTVGFIMEDIYFEITPPANLNEPGRILKDQKGFEYDENVKMLEEFGEKLERMTSPRSEVNRNVWLQTLIHENVMFKRRKNLEALENANG